MIITFNEPKEIVLVKEVKKSFSFITIYEIRDNQEDKTVVANTLEVGTLVLWKGDTYDLIGQWTDTDVEKRILELISL